MPGASGLFALASFALALACVGWGGKLFRFSQVTPLWLSVTAGIVFGTSLVALPFATYARQDLVFKLLPVPNGLFLILLLIRVVMARRHGIPAKGERPLVVRSFLVFFVLAFLSYMPPGGFYRSVIIAMNKGNERLIGNMHMIGSYQEFKAAYENGNCEEALLHAIQSNRYGRMWLFGTEHHDAHSVGSNTTVEISEEMRLKLGPLVQLMQSMQRDQLWKISRTFDGMYQAHRCLAEKAEAVGDNALAYQHYVQADSVLNIIERREGYWNDERIWSLTNMARSASALGEYDVADSLFKASLDLYSSVKVSLDADAASILANWSSSLSSRQQWAWSNALLRGAIGLATKNSMGSSTDTRWVRYRLQLVKNLISTDSLLLAERNLAPCLSVQQVDSGVGCETLIVKGALQFRQNSFHAADTTFQEAVSCLTPLPNSEAGMAIAFLSWGYVKASLAEYDRALALAEKGQALIASDRESSIQGSLLQLNAHVQHLQGHYAQAKLEYGQCLKLFVETVDGSKRLPGAMAGYADLLLDLAEYGTASILADSALKLITDSLRDIYPSQISVLNTAARADYCRNDLLKAQERYRTALEVCQRRSATNTSGYAQALNGQGLVSIGLKRLVTADSLFLQAYNTCISIYGREHPFTARVMINRAQLRLLQRRPVEAKALLLAALPITLRFLGKDHDQLGDIYEVLGTIERESGHQAQATAHHREAMRIYRVCFPANHPKVEEMEQNGPTVANHPIG